MKYELVVSHANRCIFVYSYTRIPPKNESQFFWGKRQAGHHRIAPNLHWEIVECVFFLKDLIHKIKETRRNHVCTDEIMLIIIQKFTFKINLLSKDSHYFTCAEQSLSPSLNTQSCNRRPLCSTFRFENLSISPTKNVFSLFRVQKI